MEVPKYPRSKVKVAKCLFQTVWKEVTKLKWLGLSICDFVSKLLPQHPPNGHWFTQIVSIPCGSQFHLWNNCLCWRKEEFRYEWSSDFAFQSGFKSCTWETYHLTQILPNVSKDNPIISLNHLWNIWQCLTKPCFHMANSCRFVDWCFHCFQKKFTFILGLLFKVALLLNLST